MHFKKYFLSALILFLLIPSVSFAQINDYNLDFNKTDTENGFVNWHTYFGNEISKDSKEAHTSEFSVRFNVNGKEAFTNNIPDIFIGEKLTFSGYVKAQGVDYVIPMIAFKNNEIFITDEAGDKITEFTDWIPFEFTVTIKEDATDFIVGIIAEGEGTVWIDDLSVKVDGVSIEKLEPRVIKYLAEEDKEFDDGSGIETLPTDKESVKHLRDLGLIWGYLKYYHPNIGKGDYNWDYELFRMIPLYLNAKDAESRGKLIISWINYLKPYSHSKATDKRLKDIKMKPNLDWIQELDFTDNIKQELLQIKKAERTEVHYYVSVNNGIPYFRHEDAYANMEFPDAGFRLLGLYRLWNAIQYFSPYRYMFEEEWMQALEKYIPEIIEANTRVEYGKVLMRLISEIEDSHAGVVDTGTLREDVFGHREAPFIMNFIENKVVVVSKAINENLDTSSLELGDVILKVNGRPVEDIMAEVKPLISHSNKIGTQQGTAMEVMTTNEPQLKVEYERNGKIFEEVIPTYTTQEIYSSGMYTFIEPPYFKMFEDNIGYLRVDYITRENSQELKEKINKAKHLIVDIRMYPSSDYAQDFLGWLLPNRYSFVAFSNADILNPGQYYMSSNFQTTGKDGNDEYFKGNIAALVSFPTQSFAEGCATIFKGHPNAKVVGTTTSGANGSMTDIKLPGDVLSTFTGLGAYYSNGDDIQRSGVQIDVEVHPTIKAIREGRDEYVEKAIEILNE